MAVFVVEPGERELFRERVGLVRDEWAACELIATDRRLVVASIDTKPGLESTQGWLVERSARFFAGIGGLLLELIEGKTFKKHATQQIRIEQFGIVEVTGKRELRVESTGEGYAKQLFDITTRQPQQLAERIRRWAAGDHAPAEMPVAIVKKLD